MNRRTVVCSEIDNDLSAQLKAAVQENGGEFYLAADLSEWANALDQHFPWLAILGIDSSTAVRGSSLAHKKAAGDSTEEKYLEWQTVLRRIKLRPHTKYIPLIAVSHDNVDGLTRAQKLGAEQVGLIENIKPQISTLVARYLNPPIRYPHGWDEALPSLAQAGLQHFNRGDYFEQHELLEDAWRAEDRPIRDLYQGILQIGVAFYQIELGNWKGAIKTFRRALPKLRDLPPVCQGISLAEFRKVTEEIHADITSLGPENLEQFDQKRFPQIKYKA